MKKLGRISKDKVIKIYCNCCGRSLQVDNGMLKEGAFSTSYQWGYFSDKDGTTHAFDLCEECYDKIVDKFVIPVDAQDSIELI